MVASGSAVPGGAVGLAGAEVLADEGHCGGAEGGAGEVAEAFPAEGDAVRRGRFFAQPVDEHEEPELKEGDGEGVGRRRQAQREHGCSGESWRAAVSYTHLRAHENVLDLVCRLLLEKKKKKVEYYGLYVYTYSVNVSDSHSNRLRTLLVLRL